METAVIENPKDFELKLQNNPVEINYWVNSRSLLASDELAKIYRNVDINKEKNMRPSEVLEHCVSTKKHIPIPNEIRDFYSHIGRPTPFHRAIRLEKFLNTKNRIFLKREDLLINGSFKINVIGPQVFYGVKDGFNNAVVETSAGHVGVATAFAANYFGIKSTVFVTNKSYLNKPYRRYLMEMYGANVYASPSQYTKIGRQMDDGEISGNIAKASSEVIEIVSNDEKSFKISGSLSDQTLTYNSVVGQETKFQYKQLTGKRHPDQILGCVGGGASFGGMVVPFLEDDNHQFDITAVEPSVVPTLSKGNYSYEYKDANKKTASILMYTLGHQFKIPISYGAGLTYHAASPIISYFVNQKRIKPVGISDIDAISSAGILAKTEGIIVAPESAFTIARLIQEVQKNNTKRDVIVNVIKLRIYHYKYLKI